jgi:hypothetical protein
MPEPQCTFSAALDIIHQESALPRVKLEWNATRATGDDGQPFQSASETTSPNPLTDRFLNDDLRQTLKCIHFDIPDACQIRENMHVRIVADCLLNLVIDRPPLGIIQGHRAYQGFG